MRKNDNRKVVVLLNGETVQAISVAKQLHRSGYKVVSMCDTKQSYGYHTRYADEKVICPSIHKEEKAFLAFLLQYINNKKVDVLMPMNDFSADFMARNQHNFNRARIHFVMPDNDVFQRGYNKKNLMAVCEEYDFPHPITIDLSKISAKKAGEEMVFPALIKPNITSGGRGITYVSNADDLLAKYPAVYKEYGDCHLQEFIPSGGRQIKVEILLNDKGEYLMSSVINKIRFYPVNGGSSCCNITIKDDNLVKMCTELLQTLGWIGFADFDLVEDPRDGVVKVMEINPRVPACVKSAFVSGIDFATAIADAALGLPMKNYEYKYGKTLRYIGLDGLWFMKSPNRWKAKPSWWSFFGRNIFYQDMNDITDPLPLIVGTWGNVKKQLSSEFRNTKGGLNNLGGGK